MAAKKVLLGFFLCLLGTTTVLATTRSIRLGSGPELCNLQRLRIAQPAQRFEFEGGSIETWDENDDQFQCVGVAPLRTTVQPNSLALPSFRLISRLVFIEQGEGIVGVHFPGCAETFDTGVQGQQESPRRMGIQGQETQDSHQKVHRFKQGDILAIPAGAVHWCYNDGNQDVVAIAINDLNNPSNQLDLQSRLFLPCGEDLSAKHIQGQQRQKGQQGRQPFQQQESFNFQNIFAGFDTELLAESFNSDPQIIRAMQESGERGLIVKAAAPCNLSPLQKSNNTIGNNTTNKKQGQREGQHGGGASNGLEEKICSSKILYNLDTQREADIFSRQAGKLNLVNEHKLPILSYLDLSAEKGHLNGPVVSNKRVTEAVLDDASKRGDLFVATQFFAKQLELVK
ncbi:11S globulin seed storage protein 2-like protein [Tanacetum coccineum]